MTAAGGKLVVLPVGPRERSIFERSMREAHLEENSLPILNRSDRVFLDLSDSDVPVPDLSRKKPLPGDLSKVHATPLSDDSGGMLDGLGGPSIEYFGKLKHLLKVAKRYADQSPTLDVLQRIVQEASFVPA